VCLYPRATDDMLGLCRWPPPPALLVTLSALAITLIFLTPFHSPVSSVAGWTPGALKAPDRSPACHSISLKPNLIISAIDGGGMLEKIFTFMASLDAALGNEILVAQRERKCFPAEVEVKILTPPAFTQNLPDSFKALLRRHKNLEFLGTLPVDITNNIVYNRFIGWSRLVGEVESSYDKILALDLDIVFQQNPFLMPMERNVELLVYAEWRGFKIGQCLYHQRWFDGCMNTSQGPYITEAQYTSYAALDRICAGSTYGTAHAMAVYLDLMAAELERSLYECNDQALHIHLFYSGKMQEALTARSAGKVKLVPNEEALLGTVGTTPFVRYNEWGEMLNDLGQVQVAVHQFKHHQRLEELVQRKYGWQSELASTFPPTPVLALDTTFTEVEPSAQARFLMVGVNNETCKSDTALCSCRWDDCQFQLY
jgi:hypothetical protein